MAENIRIKTAAVTATTAAALLGESEIPVDVTVDQLVAAHFVPDTAQAAAGVTNFATLQLRDFTANTTAPPVLASLDLSGALTAEVAVDFVMTAGTRASKTAFGQADTVPAGAVSLKDVIDVETLQHGTGGAIPAGTVVLEFE